MPALLSIHSLISFIIYLRKVLVFMTFRCKCHNNFIYHIINIDVPTTPFTKRRQMI